MERWYDIDILIVKNLQRSWFLLRTRRDLGSDFLLGPMFDFFLEMFLEWDDIPSYEHLAPPPGDDSVGSTTVTAAPTLADVEAAVIGGYSPSMSGLPLRSQLGMSAIGYGLSVAPDGLRVSQEAGELTDFIVHHPGFNLAPLFR